MRGGRRLLRTRSPGRGEPPRDFVFPYLAIRNLKAGYAVSIVRAGMELVGRDPGPVRPPLTDLNAGERARLAELVQTVATARV